jgi:hypothetical protein
MLSQVLTFPSAAAPVAVVGAPFTVTHTTSFNDAAVADFTGGRVGIFDNLQPSPSNPTSFASTFSSTPRIVPVGTNPIALAAGPILDPFDLVVANYGSNNVSILLDLAGNGTFTAAPGSPVAVGAKPTSIALGTLPTSGAPFIAVSNFGDGTVTTLTLSTATAAVAATQTLGVGNGPISVAYGAMLTSASSAFGLGPPFIAVANSGDATISVIQLDPTTGTRTAQTLVQLQAPPIALATNDMDGDGQADLVVLTTDGRVLVLAQQPGPLFFPETGLFVEIAPRLTGSRPYAVAIGDIDPSSIFDIASVTRAGSSGPPALGTFNPDLAVADLGSNEPIEFLNIISTNSGF